MDKEMEKKDVLRKRLVLAGGAAIFGVVKLLMNKSARKQAELTYQENCRLSARVIDSLCDEFKRYEEEFASYDAYVEEINRELAAV